MDRPLEAGKRLAHPNPEDAVVIAGISGRFSNSANMKEFQENLLTKTDMVTSNRWNMDHPEVPSRAGKLKEIKKFDCGAFGIHPSQAYHVGPILRSLLEVVFEALYDAGVNPCKLEGTKTGVFVSTSNTDCQEPIVKYEMGAPKETYCEFYRVTSANFISHTLKLNGPSNVLDSGCSASIYGLQQAYRAIRNGEIDAAIICGGFLNLQPETTVQCVRQKFLCLDGCCKAFDERANGYVKGEAVGAIFVQKRKDAKRIYSEIIHCKIACDGFKEEGITFPSSKEQATLFAQFYEESGVNPADVDYLEAHGTGTKAGDLQETTAIDQVFAQKEPLLVGSVKTNMGHGEQVSGLCQIAKAIIAMQTGFVPPNLHHQVPRGDLEAFQKGKLKVVTNNSPFPNGGLLAINSFGIGGSNGHLLLKAYDEIKIRNQYDLPPFLCVSGRTYEAVREILDEAISKLPNKELFALLNEIHRYNTPSHRYRGTVVLSKRSGKIKTEISKCEFTKSGLYVILGDFNSNIVDVSREIRELPLGAEIFAEVSKILNFNVEKLEVQTGNNKENQDLLTVLLQIVIVRLMRALELSIKVIHISPLGVFAKAFAKNMLTFEEAILLAHYGVKLKIKSGLVNKRKGNEGFLLNSHEERFNEETVKIDLKSNAIVVQKRFALLAVGKVGASFKEETNFFALLSRLYREGLNFNIARLYPKFDYPVNAKTPMISNLVKWDHSAEFNAYTFAFPRMFYRSFRIDANDTEWNFLHDHVVNGNVVIPGSTYVYLAWLTFAYTKRKGINETSVELQDVHFKRVTALPSDGRLEFTTALHCPSGKFQIFESGVEVACGRILLSNDTMEPVEPEMQLEQLDGDEVYRELHLRGYDYGFAFDYSNINPVFLKKISNRSLCRGVQKCSTDFKNGQIIWSNSWVRFIDSILQLYILTIPTRNLYLPFSIQNIQIDPKRCQDAKSSVFPWHYCQETNTTRCGGIKVTNVECNAVSRKRCTENPLVEQHQFVPNETSLSLEKSVRVNMQIALENNYRNKIKVVEIGTRNRPLLSNVIGSLDDDPLIEIEATLLAKEAAPIPGVKVENLPLKDFRNVYMVIGTEILQESFEDILIDKGFVLSREPLSKNYNHTNLKILTIHTTPHERLVLVSKSNNNPRYEIVELTNDFGWLKRLQEKLSTPELEVVVHSHQKQNTGIIGFTSSVRRERKNVRCVLIADEQAPNDYSEQLKKGHAFNVYKDGKWGTYRRFYMEARQMVKSEHSVLKGNLEDFKWVEGPLNDQEKLAEGAELVYIHYSGLSFKDVMLANNQIPHEPSDKPPFGLEFSGRLANGRRVMGFSNNGGSMATLIVAENDSLLEVPHNWSLEEAATVPAAYATTLYALQTAGAKAHQTILINSGASAIGQAAINLCHSMGLHIFITISTDVERQFLQEAFPFLNSAHILSNKTLERVLKRKTKGKGVDMVLTNLAPSEGNVLLRCLSKTGIYLQIQDSPLDNVQSLNGFLAKEMQFHSISLDSLLTHKKHEILELLRREMIKGTLKPLTRKVFSEKNVKMAFKCMSDEGAVEKVLVKFRDGTSSSSPSSRLLDSSSRFYPKGSVVITGGLGGIGLELINWLVNRGARKIVIAARRTNLNGYEASRLRAWRLKGVDVKVTSFDITTEDGCKLTLETADSMEPLGSIFHLAIRFSHALFEHQTVEDFQTMFAIKVQALQHFDRLTRESYPTLRDFVAFSSVANFRSNPGQSCYAYANSAMECVCEERRKDGLPALSTQWGIIGDVGMVQRSKKQSAIGDLSGLTAQSIYSCMEVLEDALIQKLTIVSSMMYKRKSRVGVCEEKSIVNVVANIIGIKYLKTVAWGQSLAELGVDSMMVTLIKQTLSREFDVVLSAKELRKLAFSGLNQLQKREKQLDLQF